MYRIEVSLTFDDPFNVGSGALGGSAADKPILRDARGLPMIPASTLKGRLRHEVERLAPVLRPDARPPCGSPTAERMCQGDEDPCPVCRIFGSPWHPGAAIFSDMLVTEPEFLLADDPIPGTLRYGVGLSRQRRVAEDQLLYTTEVFLPGTPITLGGTINGELDEEDLLLLQAGLDSLFTLGGGKTKGMGWCDVVVTVHEEPAVPLSSPQPSSVEEGKIDIVVQLVSPLLLGNDTNEAYYQTTRTYIPGSALRGSLAGVMMRACEHDTEASHAGCDFARVFVEGPSPVFEHLYPTTPGAREFPIPAPATARSCKYHAGFTRTRDEDERGHGVGDILIRQAVFEQMLDRNLPLPALYQPKCPECGAEVEPFDRSLVMISEDQYDAVSVPVRRSSRTAIDRHRGVAADGQLYTLEMIEPMDDHRRPVTFRGRVQGSAEKIKIVNRWIGHVSTVGSGRSRGLGHIQVNVIDARAAKEPLPELEDRLRAFNQRMREEWAFYSRVAGVDPLPEGVFYFSLDLLAPAILDWHGVPVTAPSPAMLGFESGVQLDRGFADYEVVGGWHQGAGLPRRKQTAATLGSVFLYRSEGFALKELARHLSSLEAKGIGSDRARGFGRVLICLPFHYQPEVNV